MNINPVSSQNKTVGFKALVKIPKEASREAVQKISGNVVENFSFVKAFGKGMASWGGKFFDKSGAEIAKPNPVELTHFAFQDGLMSIRFANTFREYGVNGKYYYGQHPPVTDLKTLADVDRFFQN